MGTMPERVEEMGAEVERLKAERARYRELALPALRDSAINRMLAAGRAAAIEALKTLPEDEAEALEKTIGVPLLEALPKGFDVQMGKELLQIKG